MSALWLTPARRGALLVILLVLGAVGWYLASPLVIRTTANEAFPTAAAPVATGTTATAQGAASPAQPTVATAQTIAAGELRYVDAIHNGTGAVLLLRTGDVAVVRFENVAITNAPDVHVYLSRETGGRWSEATSLYLGPLKATNGSFNYAVPPGTDLSPYRSLVVWCRQFSVLVTWADLR